MGKADRGLAGAFQLSSCPKTIRVASQAAGAHPREHTGGHAVGDQALTLGSLACTKHVSRPRWRACSDSLRPCATTSVDMWVMLYPSPHRVHANLLHQL